MIKKIILITLNLLFSLNIFAAEQNIKKFETIKINKEILGKAGIDFPKYNEIEIIPANQYTDNIPRNKSDEHIKVKIKEYLIMKEEQQLKGYVNMDEPRAKELFDMQHTASSQREQYKNNYYAKSTHMRDSISDLKLAYTFVGVPSAYIDENLGFAPYGAYKSQKNGDNADGWDGAVQFFIKSDIGVCAFTEHNRSLTGLGIELIKELTTYEVKNKPTVVLVKGNDETGYLYKIKWYDSMFSRELECANQEYTQEIKDNVINIANQIDENQ